MVMAALVALGWHFISQEPAFNGRRLKVWIQDLEWVSSNLNSEDKKRRHEAAVQAVRHMGPSTLPFLFRELRTEDSRWEPLREICSKWLLLAYVPPRASNARVFAAIEALGSDARGGIMQMVELLQSGRVPAIAIVLRETFGADSVPYLMEGLTNRLSSVRIASAAGLRGLGQEARPAMDLLISGLADRDDEVRLESAIAVGRVVGNPSNAIPALIKLLKDPDYRIREEAARALGSYGPRATDAVAELRNAAVDIQGQVGLYATAALQRITNAAFDCNEKESVQKVPSKRR
jgi:HEAT repeat protein